MQNSNTLDSGYLLNSKYLIDKSIGQGAYGIAYRAINQTIGLQVVIKEFFPIDLVERVKESASVNVVVESHIKIYNDQLRLFLSEARTIANCSHIDGVVKVIDYFTKNNTAYFVMQYIEGLSVDRYVNVSKGIGVPKLLKWVWALLSSLAEVHKQGILHLDIKPENVIIDSKSGQPILIDFGIARSIASRGEAVVNSGGFSPFFSAPEQQYMESTSIGPWTDIYGIGALLYYCLSGERPVDSRERSAGRELISLRTLAPNAPELLLQSIEMCMALDDSHRPKSVEDLLKLLQPLQPKDFHWLQSLPDNSFGNRMRNINAKIENGAAKPFQFNLLAGIFQWFWLFSNRIIGIGTILSVCLISFVGVGIWFHFGGLAFLVAIILSAVFCGSFGDYLQFSRVSVLGSILTGGTAEQRSTSGALLLQAGSPDPKFMLLGLAVPISLLLVGFVSEDHEVRVRQQIASVIYLDNLKEEIVAYMDSNGTPPANFSDIPGYQPVEGNALVEKIRIDAGNIFIRLAIPAVSGQEITLIPLRENGKIKWICKAPNLQREFTPQDCLQ